MEGSLKFFKILFFISFFSFNIYPQTEIIRDRPVFDVHAGIGNVSGIRVGGRMFFSKHLSFESSIGKPVFTSLFGYVSDKIDLSLGINYHLLDEKNFTLSFISAFTNSLQRPLKLTHLSITAGIIILNKKGNHFFMRMGPFVNSKSSDFFGKNVKFGVNVDLGYNFVF